MYGISSEFLWYRYGTDMILASAWYWYGIVIVLVRNCNGIVLLSVARVVGMVFGMVLGWYRYAIGTVLDVRCWQDSSVGMVLIWLRYGHSIGVAYRRCYAAGMVLVW